MTATSLPITLESRTATARILRAGALAGALDLCLAMGVQLTFAGRIDLVRILKVVSSGVLGPAAREMGLGAASLGLALHFLIATIWTALYFAAAARLDWLSRMTATMQGRIGAGLVYGLVVWTGMHFIVLPLSRAPGGATMSWATVMMIAGHALLVGLPIALALGEVGRRTAERPMGSRAR